MRLAQWPGVPLLLAAGNVHSRALLASSRTARFVPVHETVGAAVAAVEEPATRRVDRIALPNQLTSARLGREYVRRICFEWDVGLLADDAALVTSELVSNVVVHTPSTSVIRLELRRGLLSIAVYDDVPGDVCLVDPRGTLSEVHGLLLVAQIAAAWGCSPTLAGGKVVWATLRTD